jgi:hypothetical protein
MKTQSKKSGQYCSECGMPSSEWDGKGVEKNGEVFCCVGCAEETGCTCEPKLDDDEGTE